MLRFLGRRSAFYEEQNNAYFMDGDRIVFIDCAMYGFHVIRKTGLEELAKAVGSAQDIREIAVLVTHTHGDHVGGIPMLIHYAYYIMKKYVTVVVPSGELRDEMNFLLEKLEGCDLGAYRVITVEETDYDWLKAAIPTDHAPELAGKCFGYQLELGGKNVLYTGDTNTIEPFLPYLTNGSVLYTEVSAYDVPVHMYVEKLLAQADFFKERQTEIYLMHMDDEETILEKTRAAGFKPAPLYRG